jgi:hypothetical protein
MRLLFDVLSRTVVVCSLLHTFLPPWDFLAPWPRAQKVYRAIIYVIGYVAINARSTVYPSVSTDDGQHASQASLQTSANSPAPPAPPAHD